MRDFAFDTLTTVCQRLGYPGALILDEDIIDPCDRGLFYQKRKLANANQIG